MVWFAVAATACHHDGDLPPNQQVDQAAAQTAEHHKTLSRSRDVARNTIHEPPSRK